MKRSFYLITALLLTLAGCASAPKQKEPTVFFPPPPELPRIEYLTSYTGMKDVEAQGAFNRFVAGEKQNVELDKPYGIGIYDGKMYVCDTNNTLIVFDFKNKKFGPMEAAISGEG